LLAYALALAGEGVPVLPLHNPARRGRCSCGRPDCDSVGKHPRTPHGLNDATLDPADIRAWWRRWPGANVGACCGTVGGVVVVDVDSLEGELWLAELAGIGVNGLLDPSRLVGLRVKTARGYHCWFRAPNDEPLASRKLAPGVDLKAQGGYVVGPGSTHASGCSYVVAGGALEPLPEWLLAELIRTEPSRTVPASPPGERVPLPTGGTTTRYGRGVIDRRSSELLATPLGGRNFALLRAATTIGGYAATGEVDLDDAREALRETALAAGLGEVESLRTIASGFERGLAAPLQRPPSRLERIEKGTLAESVNRDA
jgi:hypothetical protein